jgi:hypothetical protein
MDTLTRIEHVTDKWLQAQEQRETLYTQMLEYRYAGWRIQPAMELRMTTLDAFCLRCANTLYELSCQQVRESEEESRL